MQVTTSDDRMINHFEQLQAVAQEIGIGIQNENRGHNGADDGDGIATALDGMLDCHCEGTINSTENDRIFSDSFLSHVNVILNWLRRVIQPQEEGNVIQIEITASQVKDMLKWLLVIMEDVRCGQINDRVYVNSLIRQLV
ncbi:MAG: hypothetical protein LBC30_03270 [Puniceicoccales bacterium]|jgi:hypothetical protein|nr:hypothetical protein [Puniceicoccales bacterium]